MQWPRFAWETLSVDLKSPDSARGEAPKQPIIAPKEISSYIAFHGASKHQTLIRSIIFNHFIKLTKTVIMKTIKYIVYREGEYFVSQSLNVEVSSFGKTIEEAIHNLKEALDLYFDDEPERKEYHIINEALMGDLYIST